MRQMEEQMTDANLQGVIPTAPAGQPPGGSDGNPYDKSITQILYQLFSTVAGIYKVVTQSVLATLNDELNSLANQENKVADKLAAQQANLPKDPGSKGSDKDRQEYNHAVARITALKQEQTDIQNQIQSTQAAQSAATSGAATFATILNKIVESLKTAQAAVIQNQ